jgi:hypothetical protein
VNERDLELGELRCKEGHMCDQIHEELVFIEEYAKEFAFKSLYPKKDFVCKYLQQTVFSLQSRCADSSKLLGYRRLHI